MTKLTILKSS